MGVLGRGSRRVRAESRGERERDLKAARVWVSGFIVSYWWFFRHDKRMGMALGNADSLR